MGIYKDIKYGTTIDSTAIVDNSIETTDIKDLNITAGKIAANAITTDKITDLNVTDGKIATGIDAGKLINALPAINGALLTNLPVPPAILVNAQFTTLGASLSTGGGGGWPGGGIGFNVVQGNYTSTGSSGRIKATVNVTRPGQGGNPIGSVANVDLTGMTNNTLIEHSASEHVNGENGTTQIFFFTINQASATVEIEVGVALTSGASPNLTSRIEANMLFEEFSI